MIGDISEFAAEQTEGKLPLATMVMLFGSGVLSAIIDNIPYVTSMSPIVGDLVASHGADGDVLWWALALGADLGGNATAIGASANVVALGIAARQGHPISFWEFTKYGLVVTAVTRVAVRAVPLAALPLSRNGAARPASVGSQAWP